LLTVRNLNKTESTLDGILEPEYVEFVEIDNISIDSIYTAAEAIFQKLKSQINILVNNSGIIVLSKLEYINNGFEIQFGINYFVYFLLFEFLKPALFASASSELSSRIVNLFSSVYYIVSINKSSDYNFQKTEYNNWILYRQSKTANIYISNKIERYYGSRELHTTSIYPGIIATELIQYIDSAILELFKKNYGPERRNLDSPSPLSGMLYYISRDGFDLEESSLSYALC